MSYGSISAKQQEILDFIKSEILNKGYPPSVRDIGEAVHLKSTSSVHAHLETLEKNGYIRRDPTKPRTIEIVDDSFNLTRREVVNVPLVGTVAAGQPLLAVQNIESYFPLPAEYVPNQQLFMLHVHGESMINAGILDGDTVIVAQQNTGNSADLTAPDVDKALGLSWLAQRMGLQPEEVMACGDGDNDLAMLRYAGTAVVPANGLDAARALATYHAPSNDEDGIAVAIEDLVLQ